MDSFSSLSRLLRVVVRILRFARRSRFNFQSHQDPISASELRRATLACAKAVQSRLLPQGVASPSLASLSPFLDEHGLLRVGGRLQQSSLNLSAKHPIIIPKKSHLAILIIRDIHVRYFHAGPSLTLSIIRCQFWIPSSLKLVKRLISQCVSCFRRRPTAQQTMMAPLPAFRVTPSRPFYHTGVDYAGPFTIRDSLRRKPLLSKAYVCLFICMATKAIHLEAVTSLSTEAFLATLDRFVARRGTPAVIHSDNATNFVGASKYIQDLIKFVASQETSVTNHLAQQGIEWQFIPPRSPHFGGLWEAGVRSVKTLMVSIAGSEPFTFEELSTLLARIESILNSRPLCPISESPDSFEALTPSHFLIGSPPGCLSEEPLEELPINRLSRWQHVQRYVQQLWSRWRLEYLNTLQQRNKWKKKTPNLQINDLVVLRERKAPCGYWPLARVSALHPGKDGVVRVVTIQTSNGSFFKRSVHHLGRLPLPNPDSSSLPQ